MASEQDVLSFCDITGASTEVANNFLQVTDNHVEMAISLFLESGGDLVSGSQNNNETTTVSGSYSRPSSIHSDSNERVEHMMTDQEFARRIQESEHAQVRAPIAPKNDILAGGGMSDMMFQPSTRWTRGHFGEGSGGSSISSRPSVFNQGDSATGSVSDFLNRLENDVPSRSPSESLLVNPANTKAKRLADLFRPPFDIMFHGNFEEARETAKEKNKWLMINVQNQTEFSCQVMNRDLWSDSFVKEIVAASFIFLQYTNDSHDGSRYNTFYSVSGYPHLAIIDARTGERVKVWEAQITPTDFMMDITEFLEQNSRDSIHSKLITSTMKRPRKAKNVSDMSEEEQLNAAIAASLNGPPKSLPENNTITQIDIETKVETKPVSAFDEIKPVKREETTDIVNSTRIQLRLADGSRIVKRFLKSDPVRHLFEFVKAEVTNADNQPFELVFNRTQLIDHLDETILEAGLVNAAVNCVFI